MSFETFRIKFGCFLGNAAANLLPADSVSKRVRNAIYRLMGLRIGEGTTFAGGNYVNLGRVGTMTVGRDCFFNREGYFDLSESITFGDGISVGTHCVFVTANHEIGPPNRRAGKVVAGPIVVGDGAWIGTRVTILPGITIGRGAVVATGAVVRENVPDNAVVAGVPAVVKRQLDT